MKLNRKLTTAGILLLVAIYVVAVAQSGAALVRPSDDAQRHRATIEKMPQLERDRLTRKFNDFKKKGKAADREQFRKLHAALQDGPNGAALGQVMDDYHEWFIGLSFIQQQKLRDEADPVSKADLVAKFLDEQPPEEPLPGRRRFSRSSRLSSGEAATVMNILEQSIQDPSMRSQLGALENLEGIWRYTQLMVIIIGPGVDRRKTSDPLYHILAANFPDDDELTVSQKIINALDDDSRRQSLMQHKGDRLHYRLARMIYVIVWTEYLKIMPNEVERLEFFGELAIEEQQEITMLPIGEAKRVLILKYIKHNADKFPKSPSSVLPSWRWWGGERRGGRREGRPRTSSASREAA